MHLLLLSDVPSPEPKTSTSIDPDSSAVATKPFSWKRHDFRDPPISPELRTAAELITIQSRFTILAVSSL